jgi:hypothetical protein
MLLGQVFFDQQMLNRIHFQLDILFLLLKNIKTFLTGNRVTRSFLWKCAQEVQNFTQNFAQTYFKKSPIGKKLPNLVTLTGQKKIDKTVWNRQIQAFSSNLYPGNSIDRFSFISVFQHLATLPLLTIFSHLWL